MGDHRRAWGVALLGLTAIVGCGDGDETDPGPPIPLQTTFGGDRPVELQVPASYDPAVATPLIILLHGYSASGFAQDIYLGLGLRVDELGFLYATPNGTMDESGDRFWNATDVCCDFYGTGVDDSAYLRALIEEIQEHYNVDPARIALMGHSNGGFMSFRMACDHADLISAIASLAGATYLDPAACAPSEPVHVLSIHGTEDHSVEYEGSTDLDPDHPLGEGYPGAVTTVEQWATYDGCSLTADTSDAPIDFDESIDGAESTVTRYDVGCQPGGSAELWTIDGGSHLPSFSPAFAPAVLDFLLGHPKP